MMSMLKKSITMKKMEMAREMILGRIKELVRRLSLNPKVLLMGKESSKITRETTLERRNFNNDDYISSMIVNLDI